LSMIGISVRIRLIPINKLKIDLIRLNKNK